METIFFATFKSNNGSQLHDRRKYINNQSSLEDFHFWIEEQRAEIEMKGGNCHTVSINFIERSKD